jgi:hypothetical protein
MQVLFSKNPILPLHSTPRVCTINEVVDEEHVVAGDGSTEELDKAEVVATADNGDALLELGHLDLAAELALENDSVFAPNSAAPGAGGGGGGVGSGELLVFWVRSVE